MKDHSENVTLCRLEEQIEWYDKKSQAHQKRFKLSKVFIIIFSSLIPLLAGIKADLLVIGVLGVLISFLEAWTSLNQDQHNWIMYRATCEALRKEKYLFLAKAGPYGDSDTQKQLAERVEMLVSREHTQWISKTNNEK
ncbi:MAG TPA: DUF4231 domain-containing protein [Oligoflexia bacterium]|nr:DUF4231 domain-containing protein [Oligoflexia bacterium]HMR25366.1 DUF4231 domain-containing protein [Oligoflexia bacterium]